MISLTESEKQIYEKVIETVESIPEGGFCLDKSFYSKYHIEATTRERQKIGKYFKEQVDAKSIKKVCFDSNYHGCRKCGYKDASNKMHYEKNK